MSKRVVLFGLSLLCGLVSVPSQSSWVATAAAASADGPKATLQRLNGACEKLLRMKTEPGSSEETRVKQEIKKNASALLDYSELCKRALGEHWDKMGEPKRTEFVATLRELIERNYIKQLRTNLDYEVSYGDESADGAEGKVATTLRLATKGKTTQVQIDYRLIKQPDGSWKVYDVITDELSLVRNYRTQFSRIIGGNNYDGLLSRMKNKLSEEQSKDGTAPAAAGTTEKKADAAAPADPKAAAPAKPGVTPATPAAAKPATPAAAKPANPAAAKPANPAAAKPATPATK
ncbi:MAG TPA: ABC transporter substrate-binding protein [Pseudomonadota bacterium]|nr:ABC transporter substrate-binding protein [Pseudomonadota bacterium]HNI60059.1 ABC transporter substrate-binding protein [Pseudomonadota bacterium]HNK46536.1 ABC transporter substrate-binding protein [Pseudomonadota bacterium]